MVFRLSPGSDIAANVKTVGIEQIDRSLTKLSSKSKKGNAVHETRKAMKRVRALLHLVRPAMDKSDFKGNEGRIKRIARDLSAVRDIQAMIETLDKLKLVDSAVDKSPVAKKLRAHLVDECAEAERKLNTSSITKTRKLLREARASFEALELKENSFDVLAGTIRKDYERAIQAYQRAYEEGEDELFHDWRKYVQRHWRQLLLIASAWPRALRPHIDLARSLSEVLGDDHDLYVLCEYVKKSDADFGSAKNIKILLERCRKRQEELRVAAHDMGARLLAEKPSSLAARLKTYWLTARSFADQEEEENQTVKAPA